MQGHVDHDYLPKCRALTLEDDTRRFSINDESKRDRQNYIDLSQSCSSLFNDNIRLSIGK